MKLWTQGFPMKVLCNQQLMNLSGTSWGGCGFLLSVRAKQRVQRCFVGWCKLFPHPQKNLMLNLLLMWVGLGFEVTYLIKSFVWVCWFGLVFFFYKGCGRGCFPFPLRQCAANWVKRHHTVSYRDPDWWLLVNVHGVAAGSLTKVQLQAE